MSSGMSRYPPLPQSRTGPTNPAGQPLTPYELEQQQKSRQNADLDRGQANFTSGVNNGADYDMSYTDPRTGLSMSRKGGPNFDKQMSNFQRFTNTFGNMFGAGSSSMKGSGGMTGATAPRVELDQNAIDAGDAASFARAKDKVGGSMQGLMKSIQNQFGGRGLRGSSLEGRAVESGLESGMGQLADTSREQAVEGSRRAVDLAKTKYGGEITERGQDMDAEAQMRAIEAQSQQSKTASIMGMWNAFNGLRY